MVDELPMEKNKNRSVQLSSSKSVGTEKKNQDANCKWPRGGRHREPAGSSSSKNDPNCRPIKLRNKTMDKRPKARNSFGAAGGKESAWVTELEAETGSVFKKERQKESLNHLLNFHYAPRDNRSPKEHRNTPHRWLTTQKHKYNKEQFLQANCQFVVNSDGDYKLYLNNPDVLVDWSLVEQINVQVSEFPFCPICLYPPVAAKMTRCGHVYCWSCILHYLALSDASWRKCPICYEAVHKKDLKSAVAVPHTSFNNGDFINFHLMKRARGSLMVVPVVEANIKRKVLLNVSEKSANTVYSKLLLANQMEVASIIDRERQELDIQLSNGENCPEKCFIEEAITMLQIRENQVLMRSKSGENPSDLKSQNSFDCVQELDNKNFEINDQDGEAESENSNIFAENSETNSDSDVTKYYYFYQASDGQHIYLHAINIKMLEHSFGSLQNCPVNINGRILEKEGGSMTEELRRRLRYLQHLPVTCQFEVAEIELNRFISSETKHHFHGQLQTRCKERNRKAHDEKLREKRIADEENQRMGRYEKMSVPIESHYQFPECGSGMPVLGQSSDCSPSSSVSGSLPKENHYSGPSFAKMLSTGKSKPPPVWTSPKQEPSQKLITVTGPSPTSVRIRNHPDSDPEPDDYVPVPTFRQSFSDAIALALEKATIDQSPAGETVTDGKKKKKTKQKLLFASSMVYSGK